MKLISHTLIEHGLRPMPYEDFLSLTILACTVFVFVFFFIAERRRQKILEKKLKEVREIRNKYDNNHMEIDEDDV